MADGEAAPERPDDVSDEMGHPTPEVDPPHACGAVEAIAPTPKSEKTVPAEGQTERKPVKKRPRQPIIDLDDHIRKAQEAIKSARKQVQQARAQAKLEKRKKQRLVRKASTLNVEDLERIAVLKRCGLIAVEPPSEASASASSSAGPAPASCGNKQPEEAKA